MGLGGYSDCRGILTLQRAEEFGLQRCSACEWDGMWRLDSERNPWSEEWSQLLAEKEEGT